MMIKTLKPFVHALSFTLRAHYQLSWFQIMDYDVNFFYQQTKPTTTKKEEQNITESFWVRIMYLLLLFHQSFHVNERKMRNCYRSVIITTGSYINIYFFVLNTNLYLFLPLWIESVFFVRFAENIFLFQRFLFDDCGNWNTMCFQHDYKNSLFSVWNWNEAIGTGIEQKSTIVWHLFIDRNGNWTWTCRKRGEEPKINNFKPSIQ